MDKITFTEWKNSMSFLVDDEFDQRFLRSIETLVNLITHSCDNFSDRNSLEAFLMNSDTIANNVVRLKAFINLIGLSEERLKRVISMVRYTCFEEDFRTEWDIRRIAREFHSNEEFRNILLDFFINGRNSRIGPQVPLYYIKYFQLNDPNFINQLKSAPYVERILTDHEVLDKYSNAIGAHVEEIIEAKLVDHHKTINNNVIYEMQKEFPLLNKNIDFLIPGVNNTVIIMESSYMTTTGSGQSKRADQLVDFYAQLMRHNANHRDEAIFMINYCDGFGWVGRQNDLRRIYDSSDYVLNHNKLDILDEILGYHIK